MLKRIFLLPIFAFFFLAISPAKADPNNVIIGEPLLMAMQDSGDLLVEELTEIVGNYLDSVRRTRLSRGDSRKLGVAIYLTQSQRAPVRASDAELAAVMRGLGRFLNQVSETSPALCSAILSGVTIDGFMATEIPARTLNLLYDPLLQAVTTHMQTSEEGRSLTREQVITIQIESENSGLANLSEEEQVTFATAQQSGDFASVGSLSCRVQQGVMAYMASLPDATIAGFLRYR